MNSDEFQRLNELELWDFEIRSFRDVESGADDTLLIVGSHDLSYYHEAEVRFLGVEYIELPTYFSHALFRRATTSETEAVRRRVEFEGFVFAVAEEHGGDQERLRYVVARAVEVLLRTVKYYE